MRTLSANSKFERRKLICTKAHPKSGKSWMIMHSTEIKLKNFKWQYKPRYPKNLKCTRRNTMCQCNFHILMKM